MDPISSVREAAKAFDLDVVEGLPLAAYSTFKIGGQARCAVFPRSDDSLLAVLRAAKSGGLPWRVIGCGSNVLFPDGILDGLTVFTAGLDEISVRGDTITAGAGAKLGSVCSAALSAGLTGLEFAYGIPGSVGGGVFMNCGAYGGEIAQVLTSVSFIDTTDMTKRTLPAGECGMSYRHSVFQEKPLVITGAVFALAGGDKTVIEARMNELIGRRRDKQPLALPSAGSFFKRPSEGYASALIDECGLKGTSVGGAQISEKHAGFIVNTGGASAADVLGLSALVSDRVFAMRGIRLEPEVRIL